MGTYDGIKKHLQLQYFLDIKNEKCSAFNEQKWQFWWI